MVPPKKSGTIRLGNTFLNVKNQVEFNRIKRTLKMSVNTLLKQLDDIKETTQENRLLVQDTDFDTSILDVAELHLKELEAEVNSYIAFSNVYTLLDDTDAITTEKLEQARGSVQALFHINGANIDLSGYSEEAVKDTVKKVAANAANVIKSLIEKITKLLSATKKAFLSFFGWGKDNVKKNKEGIKKAKDAKKDASPEKRKKAEEKRDSATKAVKKAKVSDSGKSIDGVEQSDVDVLILAPDFVSDTGVFELNTSVKTKEQLNLIATLPFEDLVKDALAALDKGEVNVDDIISAFLKKNLGAPKAVNNDTLTYEFNFGELKVNVNKGKCRFKQSIGTSVFISLTADECEGLNTVMGDISEGVAKEITKNLNGFETALGDITKVGLALGIKDELTAEERTKLDQSAIVTKKLMSFMTSLTKNLGRIVFYVSKAQATVIRESVGIELELYLEELKKK